MKRPVATLCALLGILLTASVAMGQDDASERVVHVKGYTRKDGTYVPPHTRRVSTRKSSSSSPRSSGFGYPSPRKSSSYRLRLGGSFGRSYFRQTDGFGSRRSYSVLSDYERTAKKAARLNALGYKAEPFHSYSDLVDIERRIRKANRLKKLGMTVDWRSFSYSELKNMERRFGGR